MVSLTIDDVDPRGSDLYLKLGGKPFQLPPTLAALVGQLLNQHRDPSAVSRATGPTRYLFPGMIAGRPINPSAFADKLTRHGITTAAGRNTARRALATDLPAAVIADLIDVSIDTAVNWVRQTKIDWTNYIAERSTSAPTRDASSE